MKQPRQFAALAMKADNLAMTLQTLEGRPFMVVPAVILVEGVHCGTVGCYLYRAADIAETAVLWDNTPIIIHHPGFSVTGDLVDPDNDESARSPSVLNERGVGRLFNTVFDAGSGKLRTQLWLDEARLTAISPEAARAIRDGGQLEVSTGVYFAPEGDEGTWNSEDYVAVATTLIPDHLALLPGLRGACSFDDGCGVRNNANPKESDAMGKNQGGVELPGMRIEFEDGEPAVTVENQGVAAKFLHAMSRALKTQLARRSVFFELASNVMSHEDLRMLLQRAVDGLDRAGWLNYVWAVFDDHIIYEARINEPSGVTTKLYRLGYSITDETVTLADSPVEVREERRYVPVSGQTDNAAAGGEGHNRKEKTTMNKPEVVAALIADKGTRFDEKDATWLTELTECQLAQLAPVDKPVANADPDKAPAVKTDLPAAPEQVAATPAAPAANADPAPDKPQTVDEYLAAAPPAIRSILTDMQEEHDAWKAALVKTLLGNKACSFTEEELTAKDHKELTNLATLAQVPVDFRGQSGGERATKNTGQAPPMPQVFPGKEKQAA